jgi:hypothetical protein
VGHFPGAKEAIRADIPLRRAERAMASFLFATAETLTKSCLYFTLDNLKVFPPSPELLSLWEDADAVARATLLHSPDICTILPMSMAEAGVYHRLTGLRNQIADLQAVAGAARHIVQLFRLLQQARTPPDALDPLREVTDAAIRLLRAAAIALEADDKMAASVAVYAFLEVVTAAHEHRKTLRSLPQYLPAHLIRMGIASHIALLVLARAAARVAHRFAVPPQSQSRQRGIGIATAPARSALLVR